jgi:hypothetical protein
MSGPKVITIVSLEEVIDICEVLLAQVDAEIAEWTRIGHRNSVISKSDEAAIAQSRASLTRMLELGQHLSLQKEAPLLVQRLRSDMDQRLEQAENARLGTARLGRSLKFTATTVLRQAHSAGIELPSEVAGLLREATHGQCEDIALMEAAILKGIELTKPKQSVSRDVSAVSRQLSSNARADSLDDWIRRNTDLPEPDKRFTTADRLIGQIRVLDQQFSSEQFERRLHEMVSNEGIANQGLMLDTICLELKTLLTKATQLASVRRRLGELHIEAEVCGEFDELQSLFGQVTGCLQRDNFTEANSLIEKIQVALNTARMQKSGEKKRQALIQGLKEIGYAVNTEMAKVWTSQKQMIVRSPVNALTGIELGGNLEAGRCQIRVVALEGAPASHDPKAAKEQEEQWCSDLTKLQEKLTSAGASLRIEKATAAGAIPLKIVKGIRSADFEESTNDAQSVRARQKRAT